MLLWLSLAQASCLAPFIDADLDGGPACLSPSVEVLNTTQADLVFENQCGEEVTVTAQGACDGCSFTVSLDDGATARQRVREPDEVEHAFTVTVTGASFSDAIEAVVIGPEDVGPCRDHGFLCSTGPSVSWWRLLRY